MKGFDEDLVDKVYKNINVPLTILGGAGSLTDLKSLIKKFRVLGVAAGSIFIFKGKHKAVLVTYPNQEQKLELLN